MLVLTRRLGEEIVLGEGIVITVVTIKGNAVRLGISAPGSVPVHRREVFQRSQEFAAKESVLQPLPVAPAS